QLGMLLVETSNGKPERRGEVLFVSQHHIHIGSDAAVHFLRFGLSADSFPKRPAIIQIVRNHSAGLFRRLHRLTSNPRCGIRKRAKNSSGVEPARAIFSENLLPINFSGLQLRYRSVSAIRASNGGAYAESALGKIQSVADGTAHPIVGNPANIFLRYSA